MPASSLRLVTSADVRRLGSFAPRFRELPLDARWREAISALARARHGRLRTYAQRIARLYLSDFDANALTGMYRMQLLSHDAWALLLDGRTGGRLLDVGAGSGDVTQILRGLFDEVEVTEVSRGMAKRLRGLGFSCYPIDLAESRLARPPFDTVSLLNVLDRCRKPKVLLERCIELLRPSGTLIVALALPYAPFYFEGPKTPDPLERLECGRAGPANWEDGARRLIERDLLPLGLTLECFARAPYLSAGDTSREVYELDDAIVVLSKR